MRSHGAGGFDQGRGLDRFYRELGHSKAGEGGTVAGHRLIVMTQVGNTG